jgi:hypothetical protein
MKQAPEELGDELRNGSGGDIARRRGVVCLSLVATGSMGLITLYQMGVIKHMPEPPLPRLDADRVDASAEAYSRFATPDGALGLGSYAVTLGLATMGGRDRARTMPWAPIALAAKVAFDAFQAGRLSVDQATKYKAFCFWCLLSAASTFATVPLVVPETRAAIRRLTR